MLGVRRQPPRTSAPPLPSGARPVLLATFDVPFDEEASAFAVDAAVEAGQRLLVVNLAATPILPVSMRLGYEYVESDELTAALRAPADLASSLAVPVELLRVAAPRPVAALLQLVAERQPGLLVLGPDRQRVSGRTYRRAAAAVRDRTSCLVWAQD